MAKGDVSIFRPISGMVIGRLWMGGVATKHVNSCVERGERLVDALRRICDDGDFDGGARFVPGASYVSVRKTYYRGSRTSIEQRDWMLRFAGPLAQFKATDEEIESYNTFGEEYYYE